MVWVRHKPGSVLNDHLSRLTVTNKLQPSTSRTATGRRFLCPIWCCSEWGLHEKHVTIPPCELLPHNFNLTTALSVSAECFCCTFPIVTYAGRYPASSPYGARTFLIHPEDARDRLSYPNSNPNWTLLFISQMILFVKISLYICKVLVKYIYYRLTFMRFII